MTKLLHQIQVSYKKFTNNLKHCKKQQSKSIKKISSTNKEQLFSISSIQLNFNQIEV